MAVVTVQETQLLHIRKENHIHVLLINESIHTHALTGDGCGFCYCNMHFQKVEGNDVG